MDEENSRTEDASLRRESRAKSWRVVPAPQLFDWFLQDLAERAKSNAPHLLSVPSIRKTQDQEYRLDDWAWSGLGVVGGDPLAVLDPFVVLPML